MSGFDNEVMYANNYDFRGVQPVVAQVTASGQLPIGTGASPAIEVGSITSPLGTLQIGYSSPNITIDLTGGGIAIDQVQVQTGLTPIVPDSNGQIVLSGGTVAAGTNPLRSDGTAAHTIVLEAQLSQAIAATDATKVGLSNFDSARFTCDANGFVSINGSGVGETITGDAGGAQSPTAGNWTFTGGSSGQIFTGAASTFTTTFDFLNLNSATTATKGQIKILGNRYLHFFGATTNNVFLGALAGNLTNTGTFNVGLGASSLLALTNGVQNVATGGESLSSVTSGSYNIGNGFQTLANTTTTSNNLAIGNQALYSNTATGNIGVGDGALINNQTGNYNLGLGYRAMTGQASYGDYNIAVGYFPLQNINAAGATLNIGMGYLALNRLLSGQQNIAIGTQSGYNYTSTEHSNITINNAGTALDTNVIRIGTQGAGTGQQNTCYIAGITGVTVSNKAYVTINTSTGQLGSEAPFTWNDVSGAFSPLANNGYFITGTATGTLPASPAQGDTIKFFVDHASQVLTIDAPGTQIIRLGSLVSSAGGTAVSTVQGDSVELTYRASDTCWCAIGGFTGTWVMT